MVSCSSCDTLQNDSKPTAHRYVGVPTQRSRAFPWWPVPTLMFPCIPVVAGSRTGIPVVASSHPNIPMHSRGDWFPYENYRDGQFPRKYSRAFPWWPVPVRNVPGVKRRSRKDPWLFSHKHQDVTFQKSRKNTPESSKLESEKERVRNDEKDSRFRTKFNKSFPMNKIKHETVARIRTCTFVLHVSYHVTRCS